MKKILTYISLIAISCLSMSAAQQTIDLTKLGVSPGKKSNQTQALFRAIEKATAKQRDTDTLTLKLAPGRYNFRPHKLTERTLFISNHDQANPKSIGLILEGKKNVIIDGQGAELIFHGRMLPIAVIRSSDCAIRNLSIDFENPHISQVTIVENDTTAGTITYRPAPWVKYHVTKNGEFHVSGEGWEHMPYVGIAFDGETRHMVYNTSDIAIGTTNVTELGNGLIKAPWQNNKLTPGTVIAMRTYDRPCPGIFLDDCLQTELSGVKVHYAEGMGLIAQNSTDIRLHDFSVCLRGDNDPRYFTTQADATHFSGCSGSIISENGLYEGMMDDAINVHGTYLKIVERIDSATVVGQYMHPQSYGFRWGVTGDSVSFIHSSTMEIAGQPLAIASITPFDQPVIQGAKQFKITFDRAIDPSVDPGKGAFGIENLTMTPAVTFSGNMIRNNRARGALFSTRRPVLVENNIFDHTSGSAILLSGDCNGWYETGACRNVVIRKNRFINALTNLFQFTNAVISIYPEIPDLDGQQQYFHSNVEITENEFETFDAPLLYAKSVNGLKFLDNIIKFNNDYQPLHWNRAPVWLEHVTDARIQAISAR